MAAIVEAKNVVKTYRGKVAVPALNGVDLTVEQGEMVAIMGPSGCGKTTLLNCLSGLDRFDAGDVLIEGVSLADMSDRARTDHRARRMGFVFQFYNLIPVLTRGGERRAAAARRRASRPRPPADAALDALAMVGLDERAATSRRSCRAASASG